jgi:hypothetical protein
MPVYHGHGAPAPSWKSALADRRVLYGASALFIVWVVWRVASPSPVLTGGGLRHPELGGLGASNLHEITEEYVPKPGKLNDPHGGVLAELLADKDRARQVRSRPGAARAAGCRFRSAPPPAPRPCPARKRRRLPPSLLRS